MPTALNTWTDVAVVDVNGQASLYVNGVDVLSSFTPPTTPSGPFTIGIDNSGVENFVGSIDQVRIFSVTNGQFSPSSLYYVPTPEPSSFLLFFAGLAACAAGKFLRIKTAGNSRKHKLSC